MGHDCSHELFKCCNPYSITCPEQRPWKCRLTMVLLKVTVRSEPFVSLGCESKIKG